MLLGVGSGRRSGLAQVHSGLQTRAKFAHEPAIANLGRMTQVSVQAAVIWVSASSLEASAAPGAAMQNIVECDAGAWPGER